MSYLVPVPTYEEERAFLRRKGELRCVRESEETVLPDGAFSVRRRQAIPGMAGTNERWADEAFARGILRPSRAHSAKALQVEQKPCNYNTSYWYV